MEICTNRTKLLDFFNIGLSTVCGKAAVENGLTGLGEIQHNRILAIGKAAASMLEGVPTEQRWLTSTLLVTKSNHLGQTKLGPRTVAIESSHPIPAQDSLAAGSAVVDFVQSCSPSDRLLVLLSGGASSLVEVLHEDFSVEELITLTKHALSGGTDIANLNAVRKSKSLIKGGKLLLGFNGRRVDVLAISDIRDDDITVIGSGIAAKPTDTCFSYHLSIVAKNADARNAISCYAKANGINVVCNSEGMYADIRDVSNKIIADINAGPPGLYVYGGEPTVTLPENPGEGGRNQALALLLAKQIRHRTDVFGLVAGTDGTDGTTSAAGAFLDGETFDSHPGADEAILNANSGTFLKNTGDQLITGPTGTNVMDLALFLKQPNRTN